ncbi:hypothetical protein SRHO_G00115570 [Serrasalmus rhombeus]
MAAVSMATQFLGYFLGLLGLVGTLVATALPHWRHTAYFTSNLITATSYMKGLWMECVSHTTGIYQCEVHRSMLSLPQDLQVARALMVLSTTISTIATVISATGMKCTRCLHASRAKGALAVLGGVCFVSAGLFCLIAVAWTTNDIVTDAYDPFSASGMKYEVGLCLYIGFASAIFSIFGGGVLCAACCDTTNGSLQKPPAPSTPQPPPPPQAYQAHEAHIINSHSSSQAAPSSSGYTVSDY